MQETILSFVARALVLLTAIPIHESAHAYVASRLGDNTARFQGRISLNPAVHFDLMGFACMILAGIGWAKPVPINSYNFRGDRRVGMAISAAAGPISNLLVALVAVLLGRIAFFFFSFGLVSGVAQTIVYVLYYIFITMAQINVLLAIFNLIPIPPFDGSRIFNLILPEKYYFKVMQYERFIFMGLFIVLIFGVLDYPLAVASNFILDILLWLTNFVQVLLSMIFL